MDLRLTGKVAFVTGASKGIGRASAEYLASEGADVVITAGRFDLLAVPDREDDGAGAAKLSNRVRIEARREAAEYRRSGRGGTAGGCEAVLDGHRDSPEGCAIADRNSLDVSHLRLGVVRHDAQVTVERSGLGLDPLECRGEKLTRRELASSQGRGGISQACNGRTDPAHHSLCAG